MRVQETGESRILNILSTGAKNCKPLVIRGMQAFNGTSLITFTLLLTVKSMGPKFC